jgi:LPS export ABC transporter protein LptC
MGRLLVLVLILTASMAMLKAVQNFDQASTQQVQEDNGPRPRYALRDAEWTRLGPDGKSQFHITASTIDYFDNKSAILGNMTMDGLGGDKGAWVLTSPAGEMPSQQERILLKKPVVITGNSNRGGDPIKMFTDQLWVDNKRKEIYTESPLRLTQGEQQATATGMRADWVGQKLDLLHDVKVTYVPRS